MSQKYGEDSSTYPEVDPEVWLEATGPNKKGRVHGVGHSLDIGIHDPRRDISSEATGPSSARPVTHADVADAINAAMPNVINATLSTFVQSQLLPILSMIPGYKPGNAAPPGGSTSEDHQREHDGDNID